MRMKDTISKNIRRLRENSHMTQAMVAEKLNMSETGYAKIERGQSEPRQDRLAQIANLFNVDIAELYRSDDGIVVYSDSHDNSTNSSTFHFSVVNHDSLEKEILELRSVLEIKNNLLVSREMEIEHLQVRIKDLETIIDLLKKS